MKPDRRTFQEMEVELKNNSKAKASWRVLKVAGKVYRAGYLCLTLTVYLNTIRREQFHFLKHV